MSYVKVPRNEIATYLDVAQNPSSPDWAILGVGITDYGQTYNPQTTTEKYIIHKNATTSLDSYQISASASQQCVFGDEVYDFVNELRRNAKVGSAVETEVLDIDLYDATGTGNNIKYAATKYKCSVVITSYATGENPVIEYTVYYNGDPEVGVVTITDRVPTFSTVSA